MCVVGMYLVNLLLTLEEIGSKELEMRHLTTGPELVLKTSVTHMVPTVKLPIMHTLARLLLLGDF